MSKLYTLYTLYNLGVPFVPISFKLSKLYTLYNLWFCGKFGVENNGYTISGEALFFSVDLFLQHNFN